ncbi:hypothetical protein AUEXF2481DRAFT_359731 [Aureobasidium subglaciale EXF-2481]|uniref:Uncharacterized protein n=1 Tax=Aureobasidium subglaciale (strain EXF-2481) TaxID=1043005 RepID=A0A074Y692_AURSE|nr:uncharacterized protein AUEXF2481DRAFT_359731 [Aureobasidium subglaciale EXF-2481]KEQ93215.1 hypothetical protein AUEXF2481DRAFT_359731 [Aureobasidium subglaciale EXF-2481]
MMLRRGWVVCMSSHAIHPCSLCLVSCLTWTSYSILFINVMQLCRSSSSRSLAGAQGRIHLHLICPVQHPLIWAFHLPWCSLIVLHSISPPLKLLMTITRISAPVWTSLSWASRRRCQNRSSARPAVNNISVTFMGSAGRPVTRPA